MSAGGPSWYDVLGVETDATSEEIRTAWREGIADLDPTQRRFALLNEAAGVLLDPEQRAAHDRELAGRGSGAADQTVAAAPAAGEALSPTHEEPARRSRWSRSKADGDEAGRTTTTRSTAATVAPRRTGPTRTGPVRTVPLWLVGVSALLAVAVATVAGLVWTNPNSDVVDVQVDNSAGGSSVSRVEASAREAQAVAVRAIVPVLSYDYRNLDASAASARSYLTPSYRKEYDQLFTTIKENAPRTKTVVRASVVDSGITRVGDNRVDVLVFVDQPTTNAQNEQPQVYRNQVTVHMEDDNGTWLVDGLST